MIKKILQKIFKKFSYGFFLKLHGKIENSLTCKEDRRIKVKIVNIDNKLNYNIYRIEEARLYTDRIHDTAILLENKIIEEASFQLRNNNNSHIRNNIVFSKGTPRIKRNINGIVLSLLTGGGGNNNYWHWLYDVLPRLNLCSKVCNLNDVDYFLFPNLSNKFQKETLNFLKIPTQKRLSSEKFRHIRTKELIVTDHPVVVTDNSTNDIQNVPIWIIEWLKSSFINQNIITNKNNKRKIYIDRADASSGHSTERLIVNENEIKKYLLDNNFSSVRLGDMDFIKQVELFYNAETVVGLHGAGFANLSFCKPGTKVIEFRSSTAGIMYENLAIKNNLNYSSIISKTVDDNYLNQQGHIQVPINNLIKILKA
ncbi:glycosyltransferase family 61 protein [Pelagibacteraceae bacterium]|nr:glycosyltransferase family 61 protein [Pelagibacteraceae bacterium]